MPAFKRRYRRKRRPFYRRRGTYRKRRTFRRRPFKRFRRYRRRGARTVTIWRQIGVVGHNQLPPPGSNHPWGTALKIPSFTFGDLPDYSYLANEFTYYKIDRAILFVKPEGNLNYPITPSTDGITGNPTSAMGFYSLCSYYDSDGIPDVTNLSTLKQEATYRASLVKPGHMIKRSWKPKYHAPAFVIGGTAAGIVPKSGWLTISAPNVPHFGLVWDFDTSGTGTNWENVYYNTSQWVRVRLRGMDKGKVRNTF